MNSPLPTTPVPSTLCDGMNSSPELEMILRRKVVEEALKWQGTPYYNLGDVHGVGVDCCMLLVRSWVDAGIVEPFDPRPYPTQWMLHSDEERYLNWLSLCAVEVDEPQIGDIVLWRFGRCFSHSGILTKPGVVVHALQDHGLCTQSDTNESFLMWLDRTGTKRRPVKYFDIFAKIKEVSNG
jgi:cell wall-associated NlpC family hydrolase